jgi:hypothetical protein
VPMTCERAEEIMKIIRASYPRLVIHTDITAEERAETAAFLRRLAPGTSYFEALKRMSWGWHSPGVDPETGILLVCTGDD